jgi:hypothetical protein
MFGTELILSAEGMKILYSGLVEISYHTAVNLAGRKER